MAVDPTLPVASPAAARPQSSVNATDFRQFAALRRGAEQNDPQVLRETAKQFEALFTKMMLESMRQASFGDPMFGSDQGDMYQSMMDDQLALQLSQGKGLGLADMLIHQLSRGGGAPGNTSAAPALTAVDEGQRRHFIEQVMPHAQAAARELGVDPRAIVAQAALETGWGTAQPTDSSGASHNLFGIKAGDSWRGARVVASTTEYVAGQPGVERAAFRSYEDIAGSVADYVRVLRDNPRYAGALNTGGDVRAFAEALQRGGYATDPNYADKLVAVAERLGLAAPVNSFKSGVATPIPGSESSRMNNA